MQKMQKKVNNSKRTKGDFSRPFINNYSAFGSSVVVSVVTSVTTSSLTSSAGSSTNSSFIVSSLVSILAPTFSLVLADFPSLSLK